MQRTLDALKEEQQFAERAAAVGAGAGLLIVLLLLCVVVSLGWRMAAREQKYAGMMKLKADTGGAAEMTGPERRSGAGAAALPPGAPA
jgi:hypothetical protein